MTKLVVAVCRSLTAGYGLTFRFDQRMVDAIHARIPPDRRRFDRATKTWWLDNADDVAQLRWATNGWASFERARAADASQPE